MFRSVNNPLQKDELHRSPVSLCKNQWPSPGGTGSWLTPPRFLHSPWLLSPPPTLQLLGTCWLFPWSCWGSEAEAHGQSGCPQQASASMPCSPVEEGDMQSTKTWRGSTMNQGSGQSKMWALTSPRVFGSDFHGLCNLLLLLS